MKENHIHTAQVSLQGDRKNNQDRALIKKDNDTILLVIADGLGGHPKGEVAAQILIDGASQLFLETPTPLVDPEAFMQACISYSHQAIVRYGNMQIPPISPRTTAVLAIIQDGLIYWSHVGDSRLYLLRDKDILAKTLDHSISQMLDNLAIKGQALPDKPYKNAITRCLGGADHTPSSTSSAPHKLQKDDVVILCTDGFWGQLDEAEIVAQLHRPTSLQSSLENLSNQAVNSEKIKSDNVTIVGLHFSEATEQPEHEPNSEKNDLNDPELDQAVKNLLNMIKKTNT